MLVEHGGPRGVAADIAGDGCKIACDEPQQRRLAGAVGAADGDSLRPADFERQRAEQATLAMRHYDVPERDELAAARQSRRRQLDRQWVKDFDAGARLRQTFAAILDQTFGDAAFAPATVLGALLLGAQQDRGLTAAGAVSTACLVAAGLLLLRLLHVAFGIAHRIAGALEVGFGPRSHGVARFGKIAPRAAEHGDAHRRQLDDAVDLLQELAVMAGNDGAALPLRQQLGDGP